MAVFQYRYVGPGKFFVNGKRLAVGAVVGLTESQFSKVQDRFVFVPPEPEPEEVVSPNPEQEEAETEQPETEDE